MKIAIVAGEKSGDWIGAELIRELTVLYPEAEFKGLCGEKMQEQGAISYAQMEKISIFGLDGLFSSIREILAIRKHLFQELSAWKPDVFIGVDVPDFNLALEKKLKQKGIPVIHYVSPTVWAWRTGRVKKIRASIDKMLALFPFEQTFYQKQNIPCEFVGHPMANKVMGWKNDDAWLAKMHLSEQDKIIAVLPGSRTSEVKRLMPIIKPAIQRLKSERKGLRFILPAANEKLKKYIETQFSSKDFEVILGRSHDVLSQCDFAILASGTAALEAALFAKPMVVLYKVSWLSAFIFSRTIVVEHFSMPNHLMTPPMIPELIQHNATVENLLIEVNLLIDDVDYYRRVQTKLASIASTLDDGGGVNAASAISEFLSHKKASELGAA